MNLNNSPPLPKVTPAPSFYPQIPTTLDRNNDSLQDKLYKKVMDRFQHYNQLTTTRDMDRLLLQNRQLNEGEIHIEQEFRVLTDVKERLKYNHTVLEVKLKEVDKVTEKVNAMPDAQVDEALCGATVVSNQ